MQIPGDLRFSKDHEWVRIEGTTATLGITDFAQDALGDVVFVSLPEVGAHVDAGGAVGEVESTKSVSEVYAPVSGTVRSVNESLRDAPEVLNADPYGEGWICKLEIADASQLEDLLDAASYAQLTDA
ncbi:MAG TPA: glycine cleavage system protein GcvH [Acidimicrobiales bacterium]|nr:glycine cleavage system protein GcvH [Acidimicrobiales bacterium]